MAASEIKPLDQWTQEELISEVWRLRLQNASLRDEKNLKTRGGVFND